LEQQRVKQRHIDMLSLAGAIAMMERGQRAERAVQPAEIVAQRSGRPVWSAVALTIKREKSAARLSKWIVADTIVIWAELPKAASLRLRSRVKLRLSAGDVPEICQFGGEKGEPPMDKAISALVFQG
jgi:hypothetical protein